MLNKKNIFLALIGIFYILLPFSTIYSNNLLLSAQILIYISIFYVLLLFLKQKPPSSLGGFALLLFSFLSSYRIIYFYTLNITKIPLSAVFLFVSVFSALFLILFFILKAISKNAQGASILALVNMAVLNFYIINPDYLTLYLSSGILVSVFSIFFIDIKKIISFLKPFSLALVIFCSISALLGLYSAYFPSKKEVKSSFELNIKKAPNRDIYIIVLDAYAGKRGLESIGFDNSQFINELKQRGFVVWENIESNYSRTAVSLSSFLNADYIENLPFEDTSSAINNAKIFQIASLAGFKTYYLNSWNCELKIEENEYIDEAYSSLNSSFVDAFNFFFSKTAIGSINFEAKDDLEKFNNIFGFADIFIEKNDLKHLAFLHFMMPHPPYLYDEEGNVNPVFKWFDIPYKSNSYTINKEGYSGFLKFANKKTLDVLDKILSKKKKPIIVLTGDHGLRNFDYNQDPRPFEDIIKENYKYYFNTFVAYYNPDYDEKYYSNNKSLVNFYINFLNENFGTDYKNKEDKHIYVWMLWDKLKKLNSAQVSY